jgi:hypothetical protein
VRDRQRFQRGESLGVPVADHALHGCQTSATTENDPAGSTQETSLVSRRVTKPLLRGKDAAQLLDR